MLAVPHQKIAIVVLETTGITSTGGRITEIGIVLVEQGEVIEEWQSLVNPQCSIPLVIQSLAGITNAMVASAPTFAKIARQVLARLEGCLFVAHDARFDYGFVKNAFRRLEIPFTADVLCAVRFSRRLYPEDKPHSLDALIARHNLTSFDRHRALSDARITWAALSAMHLGNPPDTFVAAVNVPLKMPRLPPQPSPGVRDLLREGPGVYLFYGGNALLIGGALVAGPVGKRERGRV